jgi:dephospho-CoA kinase
MFVLGVSGGIGSGKTAATDQFTRHGITVVDADTIAHQVVAPNSAALATIAKHFGPTMLLSSGELDRAQLRTLVFNQPEEKRWLENLLHPLIRKQITQELAQARSPYVILSAPLLLETNLHTLADHILVIDCDENLQKQRSSLRDNSDPDTIEKIMQQQLKRQDRLAKADSVINNNGTLAELQNAVDTFHTQLLKTLSCPT